MADPIGTLISFGKSYVFCFDSGVECFLIKESVSQRLAGTGINNIVVLKCIGNNTVTSTLQILSNIIVSVYYLEAFLR